MGRQTHLFYPAIYGTFIHAQMRGHIFYADPSLFSYHPAPLRQLLIQYLYHQQELTIVYVKVNIHKWTNTVKAERALFQIA